MKPFILYLLSFSALFASQGLISCKANRSATNAASLQEQAVTRFQATSSANVPIVFGQIKVLDKTKHYTLSSAILSLDGEISYADENGYYQLNVAPGTHTFKVGQIGILQSSVTLQVQKGDSIRIDFHLRPDLRPLY